MRVLCPECGEKSRIQKSNRMSTKYADLYCSCSDPECGHTFVMNLSYSHTLSPSAKTTSQLAFNMVKALAPEHREELKQQLSIL
ncbi:TPA: ogr/Delta-like zinc finger family protein [Vibrio parahaemolyticus]|uniref:ogr/Delta-like zinc finger family protein n=1 Tax=Vibrio harveyi group TaxID=717610 RepID=UPI001EB8F858|nr:ogr/Delta-like zinc finger family protein [Vibrio parahaemolyticus]EHZ2573869.1 ogr/Delta-like zinc finger family protein [Vibrio parahaemolyticus]MCS0326253.1 ogr/Delta-like zinc finger family protein [Vibrio diabolicus]MDL1993468.1 ogr/Delta-like zinc finger family protein [Vibrio parahaemolyticus]HCK0626357.1 ogr/Delta-like zinc finger family protein [Vibrio parahaemolyticus]